MKTPRHGYQCQKCRTYTADTIIVVNTSNPAEQLCICRGCIVNMLKVMPAPKARAIKREIVKQGKRARSRR